jgi:hypothetical protein
MAYPFANQTDLENALGGTTKLALLSSRDGVLNVNVINQALASASEDIEQHAKKLPGYDWRTTTPGKAKSVCIDLAIWHMHKLTNRKLNDAFQKAYDEAMDSLKMIGVDRAWDDVTTPAVKTIGTFRYNTPNTPRANNETRAGRMSDAAETDWL